MACFLAFRKSVGMKASGLCVDLPFDQSLTALMTQE